MEKVVKEALNPQIEGMHLPLPAFRMTTHKMADS